MVLKANRAELIEHGILKVFKEFSSRSYLIKIENFTNDRVKNVLRWSVSDLIDSLLAADIHIIRTHVHQGNIAQTENWNMDNILHHINRLEYHLGVPMGKYIQCPVFTQGTISNSG